MYVVIVLKGNQVLVLCLSGSGLVKPCLQWFHDANKKHLASKHFGMQFGCHDRAAILNRNLT